MNTGSNALAKSFPKLNLKIFLDNSKKGISFF